MTVEQVRGLLLDRVSEREWQAQVRRWADRGGWLTFHAYSSVRSPSGWPDLALVKERRLIAAELKTNVGRTTAAQNAWLDALGQVRLVDATVWRPRDHERVRDILLGGVVV